MTPTIPQMHFNPVTGMQSVSVPQRDRERKKESDKETEKDRETERDREIERFKVVSPALQCKRERERE